MPTPKKCFYCGGRSTEYRHHPHYCTRCADLVDHIVAWYANQEKEPQRGALKAIFELAGNRIKGLKKQAAAAGGAR